MVWVVSLLTTNVSARSLTPGFVTLAFAVWLGLVSGKPPSPSRALPPASLGEAVPQDISGRTSYLHVRLAFHPYPQFIPQFCNTGEFVPPRAVTHASH